MTEPTNTLADFPPDRFRILFACSECDCTNWLDRSIAPEDTSIKELRERAYLQSVAAATAGFGQFTLAVESTAADRLTSRIPHITSNKPESWPANR